MADISLLLKSVRCTAPSTMLTLLSSLLSVVCSSILQHTHCDYLCRLGEPAAGDRLSGYFLVSGVDSVPGPSPLPPLSHLHLDLQMAHCSHHAGSCKYTERITLFWKLPYGNILALAVFWLCGCYSGIMMLMMLR